jgi:hypothetical protein
MLLLNDIEALQSDPNFSIEASNGIYIATSSSGSLSS